MRAPASYFEIASNQTAERVEQALADVESGGLSAQAQLLVRASIYYEHGLLDLAISETRHAVSDSPQGDVVHTILANLYIESGRTEEALSVYDDILEPRR